MAPARPILAHVDCRWAGLECANVEQVGCIENEDG